MKWASLAAAALVATSASAVTLEEIEAKRVELTQTQAELDSLSSLAAAEVLQAALDSAVTSQDSLLAAYGVTVAIAPIRVESGVRDPEAVLVTVPVGDWDPVPRALWSVAEISFRFDKLGTGQYLPIRYEAPAFLSTIAAFITANIEEE